MIVRPLSFLIPNLAALSEIDRHVLQAKNVTSTLLESGNYQTIEQSILVYRVTDHLRSYTGFVLGVDLAEFQKNTIIHHEHTIPTKVDRQAAIARRHKGFTKPILLTHFSIDQLQDLQKRIVESEPIIDVHIQKYGARHQVWQIKNLVDIKMVQEQYQNLEHCFIVDGHHRTAALTQLTEKDVLKISEGICALFDISQLRILPFHRIIELNQVLDQDQFVQSLSALGSLERLEQDELPTAKHEIVILLKDKSFRLIWNQEILNPRSGAQLLDVNILTQKIFEEILGLGNQQKNGVINYLEGNMSLSLIRQKIDSHSKIGILMYPISIKDLIKITSQGQILPPKSTWFLPRLVNGLVSNTFR